jgi:hypothetical protein
MVAMIEIDNKRYSKRTIELLAGVKNFYNVDYNLLLLAEAIDHPYDFPFLLEEIYDIDFDEDMRLALVRIQIDSKLHMRDDLEGEQLRLYVAETIEKMLFGELIMEGDGKGKEKNNDKTKKKSKKKDKKKTKSKSSGKGKGKGEGKGRGKSKTKGVDRGTDNGWEEIYI